MFNEVHISSLVVNVKSQFIEQVKQEINSLSFTEIINTDDKRKIIVLIECDKEHQITSTLEKINQLEHVVTAFLVFHQIDSNAL